MQMYSAISTNYFATKRGVLMIIAYGTQPRIPQGTISSFFRKVVLRAVG